MIARLSILASAVRSPLPRTRIAALAAIRSQEEPQQRLRSLHSPNPTTWALTRVGFPCPGALDRSGGEFEARTQVVRFYRENRARLREARQFRSLRDMDPSIFLTARAVSSSRSGSTEAEELNEASTSSLSTGTGSEESLVGGRYCVLLTGHASDYTQNLYGGYGKMLVKLLGDPYDKWDICAVVDGQFPAEEELEQYDGFVITGSKHDAHGSEEWIAKLCALLQSIHEKKKKGKQNILGICFGHQVLSRALGGRTGRTDVGWEIGLRQIQTTAALASKSYAVGVPPVFRLMQSHQDQVQEIPPGGELLGFSERTPVEVFAVGDHVLGIQGHPEYTEDVVNDLIDSRLSLGLLTEELAKDARATLRAGQADREALVQLCKGFLKRKRS